MIPKIIHQVWLGGPIPQRNADFIAGIIKLHPEWQHKLWGKEALEELGVDVDGMALALGPWASVSNFARLIVVSVHGGIYLDTDMEGVRPLDPFLVFPSVASLQDSEPCGDAQGRICNAFFGAEPHHPWIDWQIRNTPMFAGHDPAWGVYLMSQAPRELVTIIPSKMVYPFSWDSPPESRKAAPDSFLIHWWDKRWGK
jgi:inositol phosphorylceramide mannosyltransferase catalytic subunit